MLIQRTVGGMDVRAEVEIDSATGEVYIRVSRDGKGKVSTRLRGNNVDAVDMSLGDDVTGYVSMFHENLVKVQNGHATIATGKAAP